MKKKFLTICLSFLWVATWAQPKQASLAIIPEPVSMTQGKGVFKLPATLTVKTPTGVNLGNTLDLLKTKIQRATHSKVVSGNNANAALVLELNRTPHTQLGTEGYTLTVTPTKISIKANAAAGLFYGVQTLLQLLPAEIESLERVAKTDWNIPVVNITDYPKLGWRGMMLDVSRHFFTVAEVKKFLDDMALFKYNIFHFHLTDDEGWRLQIKSLPKLTEVGAWRVEKTGNFGGFSNPLPDEPKTYGGFYTQEEIKELVAYAQARFINVVPEIDVPGHSLAAIAAYPELSCTPGAEKYHVRAGEPIMDWSKGAPPIAYVDNTLCPANEKVYEFLDKVMTEVASLFPFPYIHVGGDEAPHNFWEKNPQVLALMKKEGLTTIPQVQAYFEKRLEKIVNAKGKKLLGWDEILEGGISPTAALMSWRGMKHGIEASKAGHYVVMTPTQYSYINYMQGDIATDGPVYSSIRLSKAYQFNPIPKEADAKFILGAQANLWTEQIYNLRHAQYMTWPRGMAIAESIWSPEEKKDWKHFAAKTEKFFKRFDAAEIKYSPAMYDPIVSVKKSGDQFLVQLDSEIEGLDLYTSFDNSIPDRFYPRYQGAVAIPKDAELMRIISYRGKQPIGRLMNITVADLKKRAK